MLKKAFRFFSGFCRGYYNLLLSCLLILFIFRPYDQGGLYLAAWKGLLTITLLSAIFNCNHSRAVKWVVLILAIPTVILTWIAIETHMRSQALFIGNALCTILFLAICTTSIVYDVVVRARVTLETLRGVVCAYFLVAFVFAFIYFVIEHFIPGSLALPASNPYVSSSPFYLSSMLYFSFGTLLTIGFGDITAAKDVAQTAVVIEGIIGQFYIAILVARLVSVYSFYADKKLVKKIEKDLGKK